MVVAHLVEAAHALPHQVHGRRDLNKDAVLDAGQVNGHVQGRAWGNRHGGGAQVVWGAPHDVFVERGSQRAR